MTLSTPTKTTCAYCGVGCGIVATPEADGAWAIAGDPDHPANFGRLCSKGSALGETLGLEGRLLNPRVAGVDVGWDEAISTVAGKFSEVIAEHGPQAVAIYASGQLLTEDYYVANKLMKGFIGAANIDTNSRLCMSSSVAGHTRAFGEDVVPGNYEDLDSAGLVVLVGSNAAWCHPVLFQRMQAAKDKAGQKHVVIDPRATATSQGADLHLAIKPGADVALFNGLLAWLDRQGVVDIDYVTRHTTGFDWALAEAQAGAPSIDQVAEDCGLDVKDVMRFFEMFTENEHVVTAYSQGVNQSSAGTDKVNAIINCHLATGRIGRPGMGPLSLTGQPNAMGGREVGGMANMLAAHMDIDNPDHRDLVQGFWGSPAIADTPGLKAVELFEALGRGEIKALWVMGTNPAVSLPNVGKVNEALANCEFLVVSDCVADTDTTRHADVLLPAASWGEKTGTVTNSERRMSRQRGFLPLPGEAKPDWWIISQVATHMGFADAFAYTSPADIFREHAALSGVQNAGIRQFNLSAMAAASDEDYAAMEPVQWPVADALTAGTARCFGEGGFSTETGRAQFVPVEARAPVNKPGADYPLILNTGRVRDQWHTMTRTGKVARLSFHSAEPVAEICVADATKYGLESGALARLESAQGAMVARVSVTDHMPEGSVYVPIHWSATNSSLGGVGGLVNACLDPISGQPELKHTPVKIAPYNVAWQAFLLTAVTPDLSGVDHWVRVQGDGFALYELAGEKDLTDPDDMANQLMQPLVGGDLLSYSDKMRGNYRYALMQDDLLKGCLIIGRDHQLLPRTWLMDMVGKDISPQNRQSILAGRPASGADHGATVCSCFGVGINQIRDLIQTSRASNVEDIGRLLSAGTNCGSCLPELHELLSTSKAGV